MGAGFCVSSEDDRSDVTYFVESAIRESDCGMRPDYCAG